MSSSIDLNTQKYIKSINSNVLMQHFHKNRVFIKIFKIGSFYKTVVVYRRSYVKIFNGLMFELVSWSR